MHYIFWINTHLSNVWDVKIICLANMGDNRVHVWLFLTLVDYSEGKAILTIALGDGWELIGGGLREFPGEVAGHPGLHDHDYQ